jgi:hypothetical protein
VFDARAAEAQTIVQDPLSEAIAVSDVVAARQRRDNNVAVAWASFLGGAVLTAAGVGLVMFDGVEP